MTRISAIRILSSALILSSMTAYGSSESLSFHSGVPHHICQADAYSHRDSAYSKARSEFEASAAACYELLDSGHYLALGKCLKASDASYKDSLSEADLAFSLELATCEEAL